MQKRTITFLFLLVFSLTLTSAFNFETGGVKIIEPLESNGAIPVNIQDQHSRILDLDFIQVQAPPTTLIDNVTTGDLEINVTSTTGFVDGNTVGIFSSEGEFYFGKQVGAVAGNTITLDTPIDINYSSGYNVITANHHMNVNGAITTQIFQIGPVGEGSSIEIDVTRVMGYLQDNVAMDDALFGGINALTNGVVLRKNNGVMQNVWNVKTNGELGLLTYDTTYTSKAPSGSFGFRFRNTFAGQDKHGVTIRLDPGDILEILIQDDLTGLQDFRMIAEGHVVTD